MSEGFVTKIDARDTKFGVYYDIYVGSDKLSAGKFPPKGVNVGDYVKYREETDAKGYKKLVSGSMEVVPSPAGLAAPKPPKPSSIGLDRQDVISRQAALNSALQFLQVLTANDALPAGAKNLATDKKADKIETILMEYTQRFYRLSTFSEYEIPEEAAGDSASSWDEQE